ncbi:helix-turn-helix transcriptional regulator [bacterium]|nr:helix-turn-helix transcriptional regulator [bacterium]
MEHLDLWQAIDNFAASLNLSCSGLARKSGLDATTFNKSKRWTCYGKPRWPSTQSVAKILIATNTTLEEFLQYMPSRGGRTGGTEKSR